MPDETLETTISPAIAPAAPAAPRRGALVRFLRVPLEARSYSNLLFLALAFPLGLIYFIFLSVGLTLGVGLTLILIGLPLLALVLAASWGLTALERQLAIHLLGAEVPPMRPAQPAPRRGFLHDTLDFLGNPVTWKGMGYLLLKLPLGIVTFVVTISLLAVSASLLIAPFAYPTGLLEWDGAVWNLDSPGAAVLCGMLGVLLAFLSLHVFNGLAWVWRTLASAMLGSARFTAA
jgi:Putative sensor